LPLGLELFGEVVAVVDAVDVDTGAWVPVVVPDATHDGGLFDPHHREARLDESVDLIQPADPRSHDDHVEDFGAARRRVRWLRHQSPVLGVSAKTSNAIR